MCVNLSYYTNAYIFLSSNLAMQLCAFSTCSDEKHGIFPEFVNTTVSP